MKYRTIFGLVALLVSPIAPACASKSADHGASLPAPKSSQNNAASPSSTPAAGGGGESAGAAPNTGGSGGRAPIAGGGKSDAGHAAAMASDGSAPSSGEGDATPSDGGSNEPGTKKLRRAVSADFLHKTLSIVDVDKLTDGATRQDALLGSVDLSMYSPGPLAVAVTPDGKTALVSISTGWLNLVASDIPAGDGTLVFVDLDSLAVTGELFTGASPMGIVITKDGKHAFVGQLSDTYISYVDIEKKTYVPIQTGNAWNEELAIDDSGTTGIVSTGTAGDAMTFAVDSAATMQGQTLGLTGDAGGVAFFPGTKSAFVVQAPTQLTGNTGGYNVVDASNPASPQVTDDVRVAGDSRISYPVTAVPNRKSVVYPSTDNGKLSLIEMALDGGKAKPVQTVAVGDASTLAYGLTSSADGQVLVAVGTEHYVAVVDLNTAKSFIVPWDITEDGPLAIALIP